MTSRQCPVLPIATIRRGEQVQTRFIWGIVLNFALSTLGSLVWTYFRVGWVAQLLQAAALASCHGRIAASALSKESWAQWMSYCCCKFSQDCASVPKKRASRSSRPKGVSGKAGETCVLRCFE